jgi:D-aminoacyl-tRNA deacylase
MMFAVVVSKMDQAGMNILRYLLDTYQPKTLDESFNDNPVYELANNSRLYTVNKETIYNEDLDQQIPADMFIFATKHEAQSKKPSLSVHTQGNWTAASHGGRDRELGIAPACYIKEAMKRLSEKPLEGFEVIQECTHHGPAMDKPSMFIEVGSDLTEWNNMDAVAIVAEALMYLLSHEPPRYRTAVGIGGLHHTPNFKKIVMNSDIAIGHVCPKYNLIHLDKVMVLQAMERTVPKAELAILDWKGLSDSKESILLMMKDMGLEVLRTKDF